MSRPAIVLWRSPKRSTNRPPNSPEPNRVRPKRAWTRPTAARETPKPRAYSGRIGVTMPKPSATTTEIGSRFLNSGILSGDGAAGGPPEVGRSGFTKGRLVLGSLYQLDEQSVVPLRV